MKYIARRTGQISETMTIILTSEEKNKLEQIALLEGHKSKGKIIVRLVRKFLQDYELKEDQNHDKENERPS